MDMPETQSKHVVGVGGSVTLPSGFLMAVKAFAATLRISISDTSEIGDLWDTADPTTLGISGTVVGQILYDLAGSTIFPLAGISSAASFEGTVTLQFKSGCTWAIPAVITQVDVSRDRQEGMVTLSFVNDGPITVQHDVTP